MKISDLFERNIEANDIKTVLENGYYWSSPSWNDGVAKQIRIHEWDDFEGYLDEFYHLESVGEGYYSIAYISDNGDEPEYVLKLSEDGYMYNRDPWYDYARACMINSDNPLLPEILYVGSLPYDRDGDRGISVMEYLNVSPVETENYFKDRYRKVTGDKNAPRAFRLIMEEMVKFYDSKIPDVRDRGLQYFDLVRKIFDINPKHLENFIKIVSQLGGKPDIHLNNVGWRPSNGDFVIFDPVS